MGTIPTDEEIDAALGAIGKVPTDEEIDAALGKAPADTSFEAPHRFGNIASKLVSSFHSANIERPPEKPPYAPLDVRTQAPTGGLQGQPRDNRSALDQATSAAGAFGTAAVARAGATMAGIGNIFYPAGQFGQGPIKFSASDFVHDVEDAGVFSMQHAADRIALHGGDNAAFVAEAVGASAAMVAAGAPMFLASMASMIVPSMIDMHQQAIASGTPQPPKEYAKAAVTTAALGLVGIRGGPALVSVTERLMKRKLGDITKRIVENTMMGGLFSGGQALSQGDPRWYEAAAGGVIGTNIVNAHGSLYRGWQKSYLDSGIKKQVGLAGEMLDQTGVGVPGHGARGNPKVLDEVEMSKAAAENENRQVPLNPDRPKRVPAWMQAETPQGEASPPTTAKVTEPVAGETAITEPRLKKLTENWGIPEEDVKRILAQRPRERNTPESRAAFVQSLVRRFNITSAQAEQLAAKIVTAKEAQQILAGKLEEALLLEAQSRGPAVMDEVVSKLDGPSKLQKAQAESRTPEETEFLRQQVPTGDEIVARARALDEQAADEVDIAEAESSRLVERGLTAGPSSETRSEPPSIQGNRQQRRAQLQALQGTAQAPQEPVAAQPEPGVPSTEPLSPGGPVKPEAAQVAPVAPTKDVGGLALVHGIKPVQPKVTRITESPNSLGELAADKIAGMFGVSPEVRRSRREARRVEEAAFRESIGASIDASIAAAQARGQEAALADRPISPLPGEKAVMPPAPDFKGTLDRAVKSATQILGDKATKSPATPEGAKLDRETEKAVRALEQTAEAAEREYHARRSRRDKLKVAGQASLGAIALGGAIAGAAASKDDDDRTLYASMAAFPLFAFLTRGRFLPPSTKWTIENAKAEANPAAVARRSKIQEALDRMDPDQLIATSMRGKPGNRKAAQVAAEQRAWMEETFPASKYPEGPPPIHRWSPHQIKDWTIQSTGHQLSKYGPVGEQMTNLAQDMVGMVLKVIGKWKNTWNTQDMAGLEDSGDRDLHTPEKRILNLAVDKARANQLSKEEFAGLPTPIRRRLAQIILEHQPDQYNKLSRGIAKPFASDSPEAKAGKIGMDADDAFYAEFEKQGQENMAVFSPRKDAYGKYRLLPFRPEVYEPPGHMYVTDQAGWAERMETAKRYRKAIADDLAGGEFGIGKSADEIENFVQSALRTIDHLRDYPPFMRGVERLKIMKSASLDYERVLDTKVAKDWDPSSNRSRYLQGAATRLEFAKRYGPNGELSTAMLDLLQADGYSRGFATRLFEVATMQARDHGLPQWAHRALNEMTAATALRQLGGFPIANLFQTELLTTHSGLGPIARSVPEAFGAWIAQSRMFDHLAPGAKKKYGNEFAKKFVAESALITAAEHLTHYSELGEGFLPRVLGQYLRFNGGQIDRLNRNIAAISGRNYFDAIMAEYGQALKRNSAEDITQGKNLFRELFDQPVLRKQAAKGKEALSPEEYEYLQLVAGETFQNRTQMRTMAIDMPLLRAHPLGRPLYLLSSFGYRATAEFHRQFMVSMKNPAVRNRVLLSWLAVGATGGIASVQLNRLRRHDPFDPDKDSLAREILDAYTYMAIGTQWFNEFQIMRGAYGNPVAHGFGPVVSQSFDLGDAFVNSMRAKSPDPLLKWLIGGASPTVVSMIPGVPTPKEQAEKLFPSKKKVSHEQGGRSRR